MRLVGGFVLLLCGAAVVPEVLDRASDADSAFACTALSLCAVAALGIGAFLIRDAAAPPGLGFAGIVVAAYATLLPRDPATWRLVAGVLAGALALALVLAAEIARRRSGGWDRLRPHLRAAFGVRGVGKGIDDVRTRRTLHVFRAVHLAMLPAGLFALASAVAAVPVRASVFGFALAMVLAGINRDSMGWDVAAERRRRRRGPIEIPPPPPASAPDTTTRAHAPPAGSSRAPVRKRARRLTRGHPIGLVFAALLIVVAFVGIVTSCHAYR